MKRVYKAVSFGEEIECTEWTNKRGELHRWFGPAFTNEEGLKIWYRNDKIHRRWGPAYISGDGFRQWLIHDRFIKDSIDIEDAKEKRK